MACKFFCDHCGQAENALKPNVYFVLPDGWASAQEGAAEKHACSTACQRGGLQWHVPLRYNRNRKSKRMASTTLLSSGSGGAYKGDVNCELCQALEKPCYKHEVRVAQ